ncbi:hypothetical protein H8J86_08005 [Clostridium perfringens]|uniref:hypothetical protein n=1 Tax=Clostridium perfringens TaxID=1502 RepID=UPI0018E4B16E|nr:hypothetical protein [Clostridium perfringens]MBI6005895.1 hypothetical protein [Clostridium perfringens]
MIKVINSVGIARCGGIEQYTPTIEEYEEALRQADTLLKEDELGYDYVENYLMPYDKKYDLLMKDMNIISD